MPDADACTWTADDDANWWTGCGEGHVFISGGPSENEYAFCPYCGKRIAAAPQSTQPKEGTE